jgi:hypothetical protein
MGAAVKMRPVLSDAVSGSGLLNELLRTLPPSFDVDLHIVMRFDLSMPAVRLAHLMVSPFLNRMEGVQPHAVYIVFGYAMERLIRLSVSTLSAADAKAYHDRFRSFLSLEKASRCLNFSRAIGRKQQRVNENIAEDCFPVGKVIFESSDGSKKYEVDGMAMRHLGESLHRLQMSHLHRMTRSGHCRLEEQKASVDYLRCLSFASSLEEMIQCLDSSDGSTGESERSRLLRQLYRYCIRHLRAGHVREDNTIRRLIHRIEDITSIPGIDVWDVMSGRFNALDK